MLILYLAYSSTLKTEALFSFETVVDFHESKCFRGLFDPEDEGDIFLQNVDRI
jgi:hypothetical protein